MSQQPPPPKDGLDNNLFDDTDLPVPRSSDANVNLPPLPKMREEKNSVEDNLPGLPAAKKSAGAMPPPPPIDLTGKDEALPPEPKRRPGGTAPGNPVPPQPRVSSPGLPRLDLSDFDLSGDPAALSNTPELPRPVTPPAPAPKPVQTAKPATPPTPPKKPSTDVNLPIPAVGKNSTTDLPSPKGIANLPKPAGPLAPTPVSPLAPTPSKNNSLGDDVVGDLDDLPMPAMTSLPGGTVDLPKPVGRYASGPGRKEQPVRNEPLPDLETLDPSAELPVPAAELPTPIAELPTPVPGTSGLNSLSSPSQPIDDDVVRFELPPEGAAASQAAPAAPSRSKLAALQPLLNKFYALPRAARLGTFGGIAFVVVGVLMALLTNWGFYGLFRQSSDEMTPVEMEIASAKKLMRTDTLSAYRRAESSFETIAMGDPERLDVKGLKAQAIFARAYRFRPMPEAIASGKEALGSIPAGDDEPEFNVELAKALEQLAEGNLADAQSQLSTLANQAPKDPLVAIYSGWLELSRKNYGAAEAAFKRAEESAAGSPAVGFGMAQVKANQKKLTDAQQWLGKVLKAEPGHAGALLLLSEIEQSQGEVALAKTHLKQVLALKDAAAKAETGAAHIRLATIAEIEGDRNLARTEYEATLKDNAQNGEARLRLGTLYFDSQKYDKGMDQFNKAKAILKEDPRPVIMIARTELATGKPLNARKTLAPLVEKTPNNPELQFVLGLINENVGSPAEALKNYEKAISLKADYFDPYYRLSKVYLAQGKTSDAFAALTQAQTILPKSPLVRNAIGEAHFELHQYDQAKTQFEEARALDSKLSIAQFNLARTLVELGQYDEAMKNYEELRKRDEYFKGLAAEIGALYLKTNKPTEALNSYKLALGVDNPSVELRLATAKAAIAAGEYDFALNQTKQVLSTNPTSADARAIRAEARFGQGDLPEAMAEIRDAIQREKKADYYIVLARISEKQMNIPNAIAAYGEALNLNPTLITIRLSRARLLVRGGAVQDGLKEVTNILRDNPQLAEAHLLKGLALADLDQEKEAIAAYETAIGIDENLAEGHFRLGQTLYDKAQYGDAIARLKKATTIADPNASWLPEAYFILGNSAYRKQQKELAIESLQKFLQIAHIKDAARPEAETMLRNLGQGPEIIELKSGGR